MLDSPALGEPIYFKVLGYELDVGLVLLQADHYQEWLA